jgi:hypothetical protein
MAVFWVVMPYSLVEIRDAILPFACSGVLQKLIVVQLVKNFSAFYGTRRSIDLFTRTQLVRILSHMHPAHTITPYI